MNIRTKCIGIIGAGHLGLSIAKSLIDKGYNKSLIYLSYNGNPETLKRIIDAKLSTNLISTEEIAHKSDIIIIAVRPSSLSSLIPIKFNPESIVISCMAGVELDKLRKIINHDIIRIMPSSPMTIENGNGICAMYPNNDMVKVILSSIDISIYLLPRESIFHIFTATVCLPAAYLQFEILGHKYLNNLDNLYSQELSFWQDLISWSYAITPKNLSTTDSLEYSQRMATKGGITESIVNSIKDGNNIIDAFNKGVNKSIEISKS